MYSLCEDYLFRKIYKKGKKFTGSRVVVYFMRDYRADKFAKSSPRGEKINRIGITVSSRIGGAVVRNRIKRIIREAYRRAERERNIKCGFLIVIAARHGAVKAKTEDIYADLESAFTGFGLFYE